MYTRLIPCIQLLQHGTCKIALMKSRSVRPRLPMAMNIIEPTLSLQFAVGQGLVINLRRHTNVVWWHSALLNAGHLVPRLILEQASKNFIVHKTGSIPTWLL